jgi:hypothetical protein
VPQPPPLAPLFTEAQSKAREHIEQLLQARFTELSAAVEQQFENFAQEQSQRAKRALIESMNQAVRRLRDAESPAEWSRAVLDTAGEEGEAMWPIVGLSYGTVLGLAGAFGGFPAFALVLVLGLVGFVVGRAMEGEIDLAEMFTRRSA